MSTNKKPVYKIYKRYDNFEVAFSAHLTSNKLYKTKLDIFGIYVKADFYELLSSMGRRYNIALPHTYIITKFYNGRLIGVYSYCSNTKITSFDDQISILRLPNTDWSGNGYVCMPLDGQKKNRSNASFEKSARLCAYKFLASRFSGNSYPPQDITERLSRKNHLVNYDTLKAWELCSSKLGLKGILKIKWSAPITVKTRLGRFFHGYH